MTSTRAEIQRLTELARKQKKEVKACWGKSVSDACMFEGLDGVIKRGTCIRNGLLWCKAAETGGPDPPLPRPEEKACMGKKAADPCWFEGTDGSTNRGICIGSKGPLRCEVTGGP